MEKKRICFFCERWASGGIESFLYNIVMQWDLSRWEIDIVAACLEDSMFTEPLRQKGICLLALSGDVRRLGDNHRRFRQLLRQRNYCGVHLHIYHGLSLYYARIARQAGVPLRIAHSHNAALRNSPTRWIKQWIHQGSRRLWTKEATHLLACSKEAGEFLFGSASRQALQIRLISNGIDSQRFAFHEAERAGMREELSLSGCFVIGNVGRLCTQKNQEFLLEVFRYVAKMVPESRLLLVGQGEDENDLKARSQMLGIADRVIFYGVTSKVERLLWAMDLYVQPSLFEGLPLAMVEAQAAGLPVLCADTVSGQGKITDGLRFLPLRAGHKAWAEAVWEEWKAWEESDNRCQYRMEKADQVKAAGYDIRMVACQLEQIYREGT